LRLTLFLVGVSFVAIFICVYHIFFWVVGVAYSLSWDYKPGVPQGEDAERRVSWKEKPIGGFISRRFLGYRPHLDTSREIDEKPAQTIDLAVVKSTTYSPSSTIPVYEEGNELGCRISRQSARSFRSRRPSVPAAGAILPAFQEQATEEPLEQLDSDEPQPPSNSFVPPVIHRALRAVSVIVTPITMTIAVALPIALIQQLKALFVDTTAAGGPSWKGPDGRPPLAFILDTGLSFLKPMITVEIMY
jgi:auxin efflux carrier family protein